MEFSSSNVRQTRARRDTDLLPAVPSGTRQQMSAKRSLVASKVVSVAQQTPERRCLRPRVTPYSRVSQRTVSGIETSNTARVESLLLPCAVCLSEMHPKMGVHLSTLPCGHAFCTSCIKKWVHLKSVCPTCMKNVGESDIKPLFL